MSANPRYTVHHRLTANLVLIVVLGMVAVGALGLYMTGIFTTVEVNGVLADTEPLGLATQPPQREGLAAWLFASASAEETVDAAGADQMDDLEALLKEIEDEEGVIGADERITVDKKDLSINQNLPNDWFNVLLLGTDARDSGMSYGRTDTIIIASINATTGEIKLTSIGRDLYVEIPGATSNRINAASAYGGWELTVKTINHVFEMNITDYVVVNFTGLASIVDYFGGVDLYLQGEEYWYINDLVATSQDYEGFAKSSARQTLTAADSDTIVHLDGLQALSYSRIRKLDNDLQRGSRQRILLQALLDKIMPNLSARSILTIAQTLQPYLEMSLSIVPGSEFMKVAMNMLTFTQNGTITMTELSLPIAGSYRASKETNNRGNEMDVLVFSRETNVAALHEFIYGEYYPATAQ